MSGESLSKRKKKLQAKSPQSPVITSDVIEDSTPAADQGIYKKVRTRFGHHYQICKCCLGWW
jgi:hypothetical protein